VDANSGTNSRSGTLTVNGQTFSVNQAGITCSYTLNSASASHGAGAESGSFGVTAQAGCSWSAATSQTWIRTTSTGSGNGTVNYTVDANSSTSSRSGTITVNGQSFTVNQAGITCSYTLNSASASHGTAAESGSFGVTAQAGCSWSAATGQAWIHTTSTGSGNGTVNYTVDANSGTTARSGTITVNGQSFSVNQAGITCSYTLNSASTNYGAGSQSGSFGVTAQGGCSWSAATSQAWIHTTSTGSGNGTVNYTVDANSSATSRSGTITVNGQPFTVNQAGITCSYTLNSTSASHGAGAESGSFGVTAQAGCSWSAATGQVWIHTTSTGSGNGTVNYTVDANSSTNSRSGTITVNAQTFTVNQAGNIACGYVLSPTSGSHGAGAGSGSFGVIAQAVCSWSAATSQTWIHTTSTGSGNGTVAYTVDGNGSTSPRSGTITVNGQTFNVSQVGATTVDSEPPSATLLTPSQGAVLSGQVSLVARVTDNVSVASVEFYIDNAGQWVLVGTNACSGTLSTNAVVLDTTTVQNGPHTLLCKPFDVAGNWSFAMISMTVSNISPVQLQWLQTILCTAGQATSTGVAVDRFGNVVAVGRFRGTVNLGTGPISNVGGANVWDAFVVKYDPQGGVLWAKRLGNDGDDAAFAVAFDRSNNIVVVGSFSTTVDFGEAPLNSRLLTSRGGPDVFVAKYNASGGLMWAKGLGGSAAELGIGVALDGNDNVFLAAQLASSDADFGGGITLASVGGGDIALAKLSPAGTTLWAKRCGGTGTETPTAIAVDRFGDAVVTGYFMSTTDLGGGPMAGYGSFDMFLAKYSGTNGSHQWSKVMGGSGTDSGYGVATDPNTGNVIATGGFQGTVNFGGTSLTAPYGSAIFLAAYGPSGNDLWAKSFGGAMSLANDQGKAVGVDGDGNIALTGYTSYASFGVGYVSGNGYFVGSFTSSGTHRWARTANGSGTAMSGGNAIAVDSFGHVLTAGWFQGGTTDFGGVSVTAPVSDYFGFVAQHGP